MAHARDAVDRIARLAPDIKAGTFRFYGEWFGRAYDNWHTVRGADCDGDTLTVHFDDHDRLVIRRPRDYEIARRAIRIGSAERVRWEWYYYGRSQTPENLYYEDYVNQGNRIAATTNVDWYVPTLRPNPRMPAVKLA